MIAKNELTKADEKTLERHHQRIDELKSEFNNSVCAIGKELDAVHAILKADRVFLKWVKEKCSYSKTTAYAYIASFRTFGTFGRLEHFEASALTVLASCKPAADRAKNMANNGKSVTHKVAQQLLAEHKPEKEAAKPKIKTVSEPETAEKSDTPPMLAPRDDEPDEPDDDAEVPGGYEPSEAKKHLDKLEKTLSAAARHYGDARTVLGEPASLKAVWDHLDATTIALARYRKEFKRKAK